MTSLLAVTMFLSASIGEEAEQDIHTLMQLMEELELPVTSWETVHLVKIPVTELQQLVPQLKEQYDIVKEVENGATIFMLYPKKTSAWIEHTLRIVQHEGTSTLQFVFSGTEWNNEIETYYKTLTANLQNHNKFNNHEYSTCIKVEEDDIIINGLLNDEIWDKMKVVHKEEYTETLQHSNYEKEIIGYTPVFQQEITVNNDAINLQMIIKNTKKNKKELIIGTPVILNEY